MQRTKVVLDTNALLLFGQEHLDIFSEVSKTMTEPYELLVPQQVHDELTKLAQKKSRDGMAAKLGLALLNEKLKRQQEPFFSRLLFPTKEIPLKTVSSSQHHADDAIVAIAEDDPAHVIVVTLDKGLQGRLLSRTARILTMRNHQLKFIG